MPPTPKVRYDAVAMGLHWLVAVLIVSNIGLAWYFGALVGLPKIPPVQLHKSIGITVLILSLARLAWRLASPPPRPPASMEGWARIASAVVQGLFYVVMIGMPLSGWALSSASVIIRFKPIMLYGLIEWPAIAPLAHLPPDRMKAAHDGFVSVHQSLALLAYALIGLHVAAALRHLLLLRDGVVGRMVPFLRAPAA
jgi:cytochrome b561